MANPFPEFLSRTARLLSINTGTALAGIVVAAVLVLFSFGVVVQVMMISREKKLSLRSAVSNAAASVWAIPVLAVLACFAYRVAAAPDVTPPRVEPRETATGTELKFEPLKTAPEWTARARRREGSDHHLQTIVLSARGASVADAERQLADNTAALLRREFPKDFAPGLGAGARLTPEAAQPLVARRFVQPGYETVGTHENKIARVYWQLELTEKNREAMRGKLATPRLWIVGGVIGLLALIFLGVATYLRLDAATAGQYRFRLKLATTTLICASGLLLTALLPIA
jgi:hypothetical protein